MPRGSGSTGGRATSRQHTQNGAACCTNHSLPGYDPEGRLLTLTYLLSFITTQNNFSSMIIRGLPPQLEQRVLQAFIEQRHPLHFVVLGLYAEDFTTLEQVVGHWWLERPEDLVMFLRFCCVFPQRKTLPMYRAIQRLGPFQPHHFSYHVIGLLGVLCTGAGVHHPLPEESSRMFLDAAARLHEICSAAPHIWLMALPLLVQEMYAATIRCHDWALWGVLVDIFPEQWHRLVLNRPPQTHRWVGSCELCTRGLVRSAWTAPKEHDSRGGACWSGKGELRTSGGALGGARVQRAQSSCE